MKKLEHSKLSKRSPITEDRTCPLHEMSRTDKTIKTKIRAVVTRDVSNELYGGSGCTAS